MAEITISQKQKRFSTTKMKATKLQKKVDTLVSEHESKSQEINTLEISIETYQNQIQGMQQILNDEAAAIASLGSVTVGAMKSKITTLTAKVGVLEGEKATKTKELSTILSNLEVERQNLVECRGVISEEISSLIQNPFANDLFAKTINYEYGQEIESAKDQKKYYEDLNTQISDSLHNDLAAHLDSFNEAKRAYEEASKNALSDPSIDPNALRMEYLNKANSLISEIQTKHNITVTLNDLFNLQEVDGKYTIESFNSQILSYDIQSKYLEEVRTRALEILVSQKSIGSVDITDIENQINTKISEIGIKDTEIASVEAAILAKEAEISGAGVDNTAAIAAEQANLDNINDEIQNTQNKIDEFQANIDILTDIEKADAVIEALENGSTEASLQSRVDKLKERADGIPEDYFDTHPDAEEPFNKFKSSELALRQAMQRYSTDFSDEAKTAFETALQSYRDAGLELETKSDPFTIKEWHNFLNDELYNDFTNGATIDSIYTEDPEQKFDALQENYPTTKIGMTNLGKLFKRFHDEDIARRKINQKILNGDSITADDYFDELAEYTNSSNEFITEFKKEYKDVDLEPDADNTPLQKLFNSVKNISKATKGFFSKIFNGLKNFVNKNKKEALVQSNLNKNLANDDSIKDELKSAEEDLVDSRDPSRLANFKRGRDALRAKLTSSKARANLENDRDAIKTSVLAGLEAEKSASEAQLVALGIPKDLSALTAERDALITKKGGLVSSRDTLDSEKTNLEQQKINSSSTTISDAQYLGVPGFNKNANTLIQTAVEQTKKQAQKDIDDR